jgi:outer membrane autotransporter protein
MRKMLLVTLGTCLITLAGKSQISKGSVLLGGSIGFYKSTTSAESFTSNSNTTILYPVAGIAIKDNWVTGLQAGFARSSSKNSNGSHDQQNNFSSAGIFSRNYLLLGKGVYLFNHGDLSYLQSRYQQNNNPDQIRNHNVKGITLALTPGISYAVSKRFHLETSLNQLVSLSYSKTETEHISLLGRNLEKQKNLAFQSNLSSTIPLSIGFRFLLAK